jgi:hypothetical protein
MGTNFLDEELHGDCRRWKHPHLVAHVEVQGVGLRVCGLWLRGEGCERVLGFRVQGCKRRGSGFRVFRVQILGKEVHEVDGLVWGLKIRV